MTTSTNLPETPLIDDLLGNYQGSTHRISVNALKDLLDDGSKIAIPTLAGTILDARKRLVVSQDGTAYVLADRMKRLIFALSQSNFVVSGGSHPWRNPPPPNLFVWNGGYWNRDMAPPLGDAFVPASSLPPMVAVAYAAELARQFPDDDFYLVIVARGGTSIRALAGMRYRWRGATRGTLATGDIRLGDGNAQIAYNDIDLNGYLRMSEWSDLGVSDFYPARIETTLDGGASWIEFLCNATSAVEGTCAVGGTWRSQPVTVTGSMNWPPADGADVTVFPCLPRMRQVVSAIVPAAMNAMGLTGSQRRIDKMLIWPTEFDVNFWAAYEGRDYGFISDFLASYITPDTDEVITMPWPYGDGIQASRADWWNALRRIAVAQAGRRTLVDLSTTGVGNWGDVDTPGAANNIHVLRRGIEIVGTYIRKSEASGGVAPMIAISGIYTPTINGVTNVSATTVSEAMWTRNGEIVTVTGNVGVNTIRKFRATEVSISLPIFSDFPAGHYLVGQAVARGRLGHCASVIGHAATNTARLVWTSRVNSGIGWGYTFSYRVR